MEELTADLDPDKFSIVLDHQPQDYEAQAEAGLRIRKKRQYKLYRNVRNLRLGDQVQNRMQIRISDAGD